MRTASSLHYFALALLSLSLHAACGGHAATTPVCGNGVVETGEQCDLGAKNGQLDQPCNASCMSISVPTASIRVGWQLIQHSTVAAYAGTDCEAIGATTAHVVLTGPDPIVLDANCADYQHLFSSVCLGDGGSDCEHPLAPGSYQATITLLAADGSAVTKAVSSPSMMAPLNTTITLNADFEIPDFFSSYTGSLNLNLAWGQDATHCDGANPVVATESLLLSLTEGGAAIAGKTIPGTPLNGTPATCFIPEQPPNNNYSVEEAPNLNWGPYRLHIKGYAAGQKTPAYCGAFDVFVGPGRNTVPFNLTVPAVDSSDGGVPCN